MLSMHDASVSFLYGHDSCRYLVGCYRYAHRPWVHLVECLRVPEELDQVPMEPDGLAISRLWHVTTHGLRFSTGGKLGEAFDT